MKVIIAIIGYVFSLVLMTICFAFLMVFGIIILPFALLNEIIKSVFGITLFDYDKPETEAETEDK